MPVVTDAIRSGHRLMKTIRVFISSTGDVQGQRHLAIRAIRSIAAEYNVPVSTSQSNFQRLVEKMVSQKLNRRILGYCFYVPIFWNITAFDQTETIRERSRTQRDLIS